MRNFKKIAKVAAFLLIIILVNEILMLALKPYNFFRDDIHNIKTQQYDTVFVGSSHGKAGIRQPPNPLLTIPTRASEQGPTA